jgi:hypothetical protein
VAPEALFDNEASVLMCKNLTVKPLDALRYRFKKSPPHGL